jgi:anti-anti-sigma factor
MEFNVLHEEDGVTAVSDSGIDFGISFDPALLKVVQAGEVTTIAFGERGARDTSCVVTYHDKIVELVGQMQCQALVFDMQGVWFLPSKVLGALLSLRNFVQRIELHNLSDDVHEVLRVTQLDEVFHIDETT